MTGKESRNIRPLPRTDELKEELARLNYRTRYLHTLKTTIYLLVTISAIAILLTTFWFPVLKIYGNSMTPTLKSQDYVVTVREKSIASGELVAFYYNNKILVKRVIATSGQWVSISDEGRVTVDGQLLEEPYIRQFSLGTSTIAYPYQVPDGKLFVLGDHRSVSLDSRTKELGPISEEQVVGKLLVRVWPFQRIGKIE